MDSSLENLYQIGRLTSIWYQTFGVDHLFFNIDDMSNVVTNQESKLCCPLSFSSVGVSSIDELRTAVFKLDHPLKKMARNTVFADGDPKSDLMIIGEAPGQDEDEQGKPFVGQSGKLLNNMLSAIGMSRDDVYISNILFWRPPGNRTPSADEISFCMPYVEQHVKLVHPKVILLLGSVAVRAILNTSESISKIRGSHNTYLGIKTIATFHPAYLLRSPGQKAVAFRDFIAVKKSL